MAHTQTLYPSTAADSPSVLATTVAAVHNPSKVASAEKKSNEKIPSASILPIIPLTSCFADTVKPEELTEISNLGFGNYGTVKACRYKGNTVAVKYFDPSNTVLDIAYEAKALATFHSPRIPKLLGISYSARLLVIEYIPNGTLTQFARSSKVNFDTGIKILIDISGAAKHIHQNGWIHLDLKGRNILLDHAHHAYITDFGLSCLRANAGAAGTAYWMAPELFSKTGGTYAENPPTYPEKADVYSFGMMMLEIFRPDAVALGRKMSFEETQQKKLGRRFNTYIRDKANEIILAYAHCKTTATAIATLIKRCTLDEPTLRPCFAEIEITLSKLATKMKLTPEEMTHTVVRPFLSDAQFDESAYLWDDIYACVNQKLF